MNLVIIKKNDSLLIEYSPDNGTQWLTELFQNNEGYNIKKTFYVSNNDIVKDNHYEDDDISNVFKIGSLKDDYYEIHKKILGTHNDVLFHKSCNIEFKHFVVNNNISILRRFEGLANQQIVIGGDKETTIPEEVFNDIINSFPTRTEQNHYVNSRITNVLSQYLYGVKDSEEAFEKYLEKRNKIGNISTFLSIKKYEYEKYLFVLATLKEMLKNIINYSESDWQKNILDIILLLYPKYVMCFSEVKIKDFYSNPLKPTDRYVDLMLIDSNGNIDVIEIKKPFDDCVISKGKYRDNYTPMKTLSGTIMQLEKYIYHLNKWGINGEKVLSERYRKKLPDDLNIKITNPKGIAILGRGYNLNNEQIFDMEIIKRKYTNLVDIITYDDLINRLELLLEKYK